MLTNYDECNIAGLICKANVSCCVDKQILLWQIFSLASWYSEREGEEVFVGGESQ